MPTPEYFDLPCDDNGFLTGKKIHRTLETNIKKTLGNTNTILKILNGSHGQVSKPLKMDNLKVSGQISLKNSQQRNERKAIKLPAPNRKTDNEIKAISHGIQQQNSQTKKMIVLSGRKMAAHQKTERQQEQKTTIRLRDNKGRFVASQKERKTQNRLLHTISGKMGAEERQNQQFYTKLLKLLPTLKSAKGKSSGLLDWIPGGRMLKSVMPKRILASGAGRGKSRGKGGFFSRTRGGGLGKIGRRLGILGLGFTAWDALKVENSSMDRGDKNREHVKSGLKLGSMAAGGLAGAKIGALAGSIIPGAGTAIGGIVGGIVGSIAGADIADYGIKKLGQAIDPKLSKKMLGSWDGFMEVSKSSLNKVFQSLPQSFQNAITAVKDSVGGAINQATEAWNQSDLGKGVNKAIDKSVQAISQTVQNVKETGAKATQWIGNALSSTAASMSSQFKNIGYGYGSKILKSGTIDCSGWVDLVQRSTIKNINSAMGKKIISDNKAKAMLIAAKGGAASEVKYAQEQGSAMQDGQITADKLRDGMVIGMSKADTRNNGRYKGIGHVVTVFTDPKTGEKMISESAVPETINGKHLKGGVRIRRADEYLKTEAEKRKKDKYRHLYAGDPYAQERRQIDQVAAQKGRESVNDAAISGAAEVVGQKVDNTAKGAYQFVFGNKVDDYLAESAKRYGVSETYLRGVAKKEGGWKGAKSSTGALGIGQFTRGTWNDLLRRFPQEATAIGMKEITDGNKHTRNDPRRNNRANALAMGLFTQKQIDPSLRLAGVPLTDENRYLVHNLGSGVVPLLAGKTKNIAKLEKGMRKNAKGKYESQIDFLKRQGGSFKTHLEIANKKAITNQPIPISTPKALQKQQAANLKKIEGMKINPMPQTVAEIKQQQQKPRLVNSSVNGLSQDDGRIPHLPSRQVSNPTIAYAVSGGTNG